MLLGEFTKVRVAGMSVVVPSQEVQIDSFNSIFGEKVVQDFTKMVGIKKYHKAKSHQTAADMAVKAAEDIFSKQAINPTEIGLVLFVTQKPDVRMPSTANFIHRRLGLSEDCTAIDLNLACSGFIFAMHTAAAYLQSVSHKKVLVLTGDTSSRTMSPEDRTTIMLFGDSASATLLESCDDSQSYLRSALRSDGSRFKSIVTPSGAYRNMNAKIEREIWSDGISRSNYDTRMKGMEVFGFSITDVPKLLKEFMGHFQTGPDFYDVFALHQANMYILKQIGRKLKIPKEKILMSIEEFGNNSSNSVPLTICDNYGSAEGGEIKVLMSGFGAGLSWACADTLLNMKVVNPIVFID